MSSFLKHIRIFRKHIAKENAIKDFRQWTLGEKMYLKQLFKPSFLLSSGISALLLKWNEEIYDGKAEKRKKQIWYSQQVLEGVLLESDSH